MTQDNKIFSDNAMDTLFRTARTYHGWKEDDVTETLIRAVYDLAKWGPTSANCCPARFVFLSSQEAKERLKPHLMEGNVEQTMSAPVTAIIANDLKFYEELPRLFPHADAKSWFEGKPDFIKETAMRNGSLQGAYLMLAARSLGLDCGPMSGFNTKGVKEEFFSEKNVQVNFLCNIGYGDEDSLHDRGPRLSFDEACEII